MNRFFVLFASLLLLVSCSRDIGRETRGKLCALSEAGEFSTAQFTVTKILSASDFVWWKIGERKMLISCEAYLEAGVDMSEYDESKTRIDSVAKSIRLVLPEVKLLSLNLPPEQVKVAYERVTGLRSAFTAQELNSVLTKGETEIRAEVPQLGILETAKLNAEVFFRTVLTQLGYKDIVIEFE